MSKEPSSSPERVSSDHDDSELPIMINDHPYPDITRNQPDVITLTSYSLGIVLGIFVGNLPVLKFRSINFYIISLSAFHFLEYFITARYNPGKVHTDSFLLFGNGKEYIGAHTFALMECLLEYTIWPKSKNTEGWKGIIVSTGAIATILGQIIRSMAMRTAGQSFSHILKRKKEEDHTLVTTGLYAFFRHPSYFGFFWWALGLQMVLLNPLSFILFSIVLWRFFSQRINIEEKYLVQFFGNQYTEYKLSTKIWIPFIN